MQAGGFPGACGYFEGTMRGLLLLGLQGHLYSFEVMFRELNDLCLRPEGFPP
jgi:hypothetical protein